MRRQKNWSGASRSMVTIVAAVCGTLVAVGCGPKRPPAGPPTQQQTEQPDTVSDTASDDDPAAVDRAPRHVPIVQLAPDPSTEIRVAGIISQVVGMRLVPPKVIFKVRDKTGEVTALINEQARLTEGQKVEMVGHYKAIPSPMHDGPGDGPEEPVFVVDRFIAF